MAALKRVAVVRLDALGDTLLSTPALALLRQHCPQAEILALASAAGAAVLRPLCEVQVVSGEQSWKELGRLLRDFRPEGVLCFSEKRRAALATWASHAPLRVGFDPGWSQPLKALGARLFFQRTLPFANDLEVDPGLHECERYARLVELLLDRSGLEVPSLQLQPQDHHYERARAVEPALGVQLTPKWCRFGVTVQHLRQWLESLPRPQLGLVGPAEEEWARQHFPDLPLYCSHDLFEYAAVLERLPVLVTIDTGAAHVAAARGVPVVDVFPSLHWEHCTRRWSPWRCPHRLVRLEEAGQELPGAVAALWNAAG